MFSGSSPCLLGQHGSCSSAQLTVKLSENMLQNLLHNLPPQTVASCEVQNPNYKPGDLEAVGRADEVGEERHDAQHVVVVHGVVQHVVHVIRGLKEGGNIEDLFDN